MSDFNLVDPRGWEYDLQSVYAAYMGYFQLHGIPWYERSWGHLFESFESFLAFSWPVITVTDAWTSKAHIVTRMTSIGAFLKMIKTRFGETLPVMENMLLVRPFESAQRHLRTVSDFATYKKLHQTLPAAVLSALKAKVRSGEPAAVKQVWAKKDKTFLAIDFEWSERNTSSCLEFGYATVRCGHLDALGVWPPVPDTNYRKGHYIVSEYADKVFNKHCPTYPWQYAFGESQVVPKAKLPVIVQSVFSLVSPDSETTANNLVLVGHGISADLQRLEEMKIKIPHNVLIIDTATYERALFATGERGAMQDPRSSGSQPQPRAPGSTLSLGNLLSSFPSPASSANGHGKGLADVQMHNSGNDAFMCLYAMQKLLDPEGTKVPDTRKGKGAGLSAKASGLGLNGAAMGIGMGMGMGRGMMVYPAPYMSMPSINMKSGSGGQLSPGLSQSQSQTQSQQRSSMHIVRPGNGNGTGTGGGGLSPPDEFGMRTQSRNQNQAQTQTQSGSRAARSPGKGPRVDAGTRGAGGGEGKIMTVGGTTMGISTAMKSMASR